jgi:hypothetical protein
LSRAREPYSASASVITAGDTLEPRPVVGKECDHGPDVLLTHHASCNTRALSRNRPEGGPSAPTACRTNGVDEGVGIENSVRHRRKFAHRVAAVRLSQERHLEDTPAGRLPRGIGRAFPDTCVGLVRAGGSALIGCPRRRGPARYRTRETDIASRPPECGRTGTSRTQASTSSCARCPCDSWTSGRRTSFGPTRFAWTHSSARQTHGCARAPGWGRDVNVEADEHDADHLRAGMAPCGPAADRHTRPAAIRRCR